MAVDEDGWAEQSLINSRWGAQAADVTIHSSSRPGHGAELGGMVLSLTLHIILIF